MTTRCATLEAARRTVLHFNGNEYHLHDLLGRFDRADPGPQVFLVELVTPFGVIRPHFHEVDQFQVIVGGRAKLGREHVEPAYVHYTDGHTTYGPIAAGEEGVAFVTVRADGVAGSRYMPESRDLKGPRGETFGAQLGGSGPSVAAVDVLGATSTGTLAREYALPPGASSSWAEDPLGRTSFLLVVRGSLVVDGVAASEGSCVERSDPSTAVRLEAGPAGGVAVELVFRRPAGASARVEDGREPDDDR